MARRSNPEIDRRIAEEHARHRSEADIAAMLTREGHRITASGVHRALGRLGLAKARTEPKRRPANTPAPAAPLAVAAPAEDAGEPGDVAGAGVRLERTIASLERVAAQAEADKDVGRVVAAQRAITQAMALAARLAPPPRVDVDDRPDMVAAAKRGRERMHALLDRLLKTP